MIKRESLSLAVNKAVDSYPHALKFVPEFL